VVDVGPPWACIPGPDLNEHCPEFKMVQKIPS
jgi:hypothetical protein